MSFFSPPQAPATSPNGGGIYLPPGANNDRAGVQRQTSIPTPTLSLSVETSSDTTQSTFALTPDNDHQPAFFNPAPGGGGIGRAPSPVVQNVNSGSPYPQLERRSFRDISSEGDVVVGSPIASSGGEQSGLVGGGGGAGSGGAGGLGRSTSSLGRSRNFPAAIGTIGDGRKFSSSSSDNSPQPQSGATTPTTTTTPAAALFDNRGPFSSSTATPSEGGSSRPSSFILDLLPSSNRPSSTSNSPTKDSSLLFGGGNNLLPPTSRSPSPTPGPRSASPLSTEDTQTRLNRLESTVSDLTSLVHHDLRTLKDQVAFLLLQARGANNNGGPVLQPIPLNLQHTSASRGMGTDSPLLTLRSPSPHSSPAFPSRTLQHQHSSSHLSTDSSALSDSGGMGDSGAGKDEQLKALTAQVNSLAAALAHVVQVSGVGVAGPLPPPLHGSVGGGHSPSPSPLLGQHSHLHPVPHRQRSLPPSLSNGALNHNVNGSGGVMSPAAIGLGVEAGVSGGSRSPLLRPVSVGPGIGSGGGLGIGLPSNGGAVGGGRAEGGLSRHSSLNSNFGGGGGGRSPSGAGGGGSDRTWGRGDDGVSLEAGHSNSWENGNGHGLGIPSSSMVGGGSPMIGAGGGGGGGGGGSNPPGSLGGKWESLGIGNELFRTIAKYGLGPPTKIQAKAIPCVLRNQDIVSQAPSIQERIQSYVVPALQLLLSGDGSGTPIINNKGIQVIIITATVDQAAQAQRLSVGLGGTLGIRTSLCVGQGDVTQDLHNIVKNPPHVLVGTPQKLLDLFSTRQLATSEVRLLVIDECDQLIARNLSEYVAGLVKMLPPSGSGGPPASPTTLIRSPLPGAFDTTPRFADSPRFSTTPSMSSGAFGSSGNSNAGPSGGGLLASDRQTIIFSCTVPQDVLNFASSLQLREPVRVLVRREGNDSSSPSVRGVKAFYLYIAVGGSVVGPNGVSGANKGKAGRDAREWKLEALADLCEDYQFDLAVLFCSSVDAVEAVSYKLGTRGIEALALHSDMGQAARQSIMTKFRSAPGLRSAPSKRVLVVYDALCRTLTDVGQVPLCINYDLPRAVEDYIHRIACATGSGYGRGSGIVINFVTPGSDVDRLRAIESFYRCKINELPPINSA